MKCYLHENFIKSPNVRTYQTPPLSTDRASVPATLNLYRIFWETGKHRLSELSYHVVHTNTHTHVRPPSISIKHK